MNVFSRAASIVRNAFGKSKVHKDVFVIPQGPLTILRPALFAPDGIYLEDIEFFLQPGQSQDVGALFTQRQINESLNLKEAILSGGVTYIASGTTPIPDPVTSSSTVSSIVQVKDAGGTVINPAIEDGHLASIDNELAAILTALGGGAGQNVYDQASVPGGGIGTSILSYAVPAGKTFTVSSLVGWGDVDAEYQLQIDSTQVGGGRSSIAMPTLTIAYGTGTIKATAGQTVTVVAFQYSSAAHVLKTNLGGVLN